MGTPLWFKFPDLKAKGFPQLPPKPPKGYPPLGENSLWGLVSLSGGLKITMLWFIVKPPKTSRSGVNPRNLPRRSYEDGQTLTKKKFDYIAPCLMGRISEGNVKPLKLRDQPFSTFNQGVGGGGLESQQSNFTKGGEGVVATPRVSSWVLNQGFQGIKLPCREFKLKDRVSLNKTSLQCCLRQPKSDFNCCKAIIEALRILK
eukprot:TRINITY_DN26718_c0_g3_i1.p1 TRINITY_DN26718_c0_g3~~TRINITY_DN26718_c0_g3_i1.p1  ORF type:complete len:202 (-),score=30.15 TRINITY_DN26718_c0_g3_i1:709-1314(-)